MDARLKRQAAPPMTLRIPSYGAISRRMIGQAGIFVVVAATVSAASAAAQDRAQLFGSCFVRLYDRAHMASHPGQRVAAISVQFQSFEDSLLAGLSYKLRYGPKFGVSGDCYRDIEGGFLCDACGSTDSCQGNGETFKILWAGGDTIRLVNDATGIVAENADGGRDRLEPGGEHGEFLLQRGTPDECAW
jgi:hypothetical protein